MKHYAILTAATFATALATSAFAAGSSSSEPPKETKTATDCKESEVWDEKTQTCVKSEASNITDDQRYEGARELAYAGQYDRAIMVLDSAANQNDPRILNYRGFTARKLGQVDVAMAFYEKALAADPDYILARSYMGQGLIEQDDLAGAYAQLQEIDARGGRDTWAYDALDQALRGIKTDY